MIGAHGIDTVRLQWHSPMAVEHLLRRSGWTPRQRGRKQLDLRICGGVVSVLDSAHFAIEGRLVVLVGEDGGGSLLIPAGRLVNAVERIRAELASLGIVVAEPIVTRLDLAADLVFERSADGLDFMEACGDVLNLVRVGRVVRVGNDGRVRSMWWETTHGIVARLYDAGRRHKTHRAGKRVRLEVEERWERADARTVEQVLSLDLAELYRHRFAQLANVGRSVVAFTRSAAIREVSRREELGTLAHKEAMTLVGQIAKLEYPGPLEPRERRYLTAELRNAGIALDLVGDCSPVDVGSPLAQLVNAWRDVRQ